MKRRLFLLRTGQAAAATTAPVRALLSSFDPNAISFASLSQGEEKTLNAVLDILLPGDAEFPGAVQAGCTRHLVSVLTDPEIEAYERKKLRDGIHKLERMSPPFASLDAPGRAKAFEQFVDTDFGDSWASLVLTYAFEALLGDPVYGGNKDQSGWKWLQIIPGFPRPPKPKWYR